MSYELSLVNYELMIGQLGGHSGIIPGSFRDHSGFIPGSFRAHSGVIPGSIQSHFGIILGSFGVIPGLFQDHSRLIRRRFGAGSAPAQRWHSAGTTKITALARRAGRPSGGFRTPFST